MVMDMNKTQKSIIVYINEPIITFLNNKAESGYKISSYVRFIILKEMKKEQEEQKVPSNGN
jgi:uncharacterized protein YfbU (UPF0304 family)